MECLSPNIITVVTVENVLFETYHNFRIEYFSAACSKFLLNFSEDVDNVTLVQP